jgi:hypothetical protein
MSSTSHSLAIDPSSARPRTTSHNHYRRNEDENDDDDDAPRVHSTGGRKTLDSKVKYLFASSAQRLDTPFGFARARTFPTKRNPRRAFDRTRGFLFGALRARIPASVHRNAALACEGRVGALFGFG